METKRLPDSSEGEADRRAYARLVLLFGRLRRHQRHPCAENSQAAEAERL